MNSRTRRSSLRNIFCHSFCAGPSTLAGRWPVAPGLNDTRQPRHGSRIFREAVELLYQCIDFLPRGKAILKDSKSDVFQRDGVQKLDLAMSSYWLNNGHFNLLKAAVRDQDRQAWPDIWIAASSADHFAIEFTVSLKCFGFGIGEMPIEVYVLKNDEPAGTQISIKRGDSLGWVVKVRNQEPCINNIENGANIIIRGCRAIGTPNYEFLARLHRGERCRAASHQCPRR